MEGEREDEESNTKIPQFKFGSDITDWTFALPVP